MIEQVSIYLTAMVLGIMLFFSFVIAPVVFTTLDEDNARKFIRRIFPVSYTHLRAHETVLDLVCRLLLEKKLWPAFNAKDYNKTVSYTHLTLPTKRIV